MKKIKNICFLLCSFLVMSLFFSCVSVPSGTNKKSGKTISRNLTAKPVLSEKQLVRFFMKQNPSADSQLVSRLASYYVAEAKIEGINSDCAFAQMCHETGFLKFGNLVVPQMHNYCGLGAMDKDHPGEWFETEQIGVRAHIQHLQAYATTEDVSLHQSLVDPRYSWVHKTKFAVTIFDLAGTWATDLLYGKKIDSILSKMESL